MKRVADSASQLSRPAERAAARANEENYAHYLIPMGAGTSLNQPMIRRIVSYVEYAGRATVEHFGRLRTLGPIRWVLVTIAFLLDFARRDRWAQLVIAGAMTVGSFRLFDGATAAFFFAVGLLLVQWLLAFRICHVPLRDARWWLFVIVVVIVWAVGLPVPVIGPA